MNTQSDHSQGPPPVLHLPLSLSTSLTLYQSLTSFSLPIPHRCGSLPCFLVSQFPQLFLPGGSIPSRSVAQHCHCAQLLCPTELPLPSGFRAVSQHCHPSAIPLLFPLYFWQSTVNLDHRFPSQSSCTLPVSITLEKALQIHSSTLSCV